jgi:hypothetical protein
MEVKTKITMSRRSGRGSRRITCHMTILIDSILRAGDTANERVGHQDRQRLKIRSSDSNLRDEQNCRQNLTHEQVSRLLVRLRRGLPTATSVFIFGQCLAHLIEVSLGAGVPRAS